LSERAEGESASQAEVSRLMHEASSARDEANAAREHTSRLEQQLSEHSQGETASQAEVSRLMQELAALRDEANASGARVAHLEQQLADHATGQTASQEESARLAQDAQTARDEASAAAERARQLEQQLAERESAGDAEKESLRQEHLSVQARVAATEEEIGSLQSQISNQAKTHAKAYDELRTNAEQWVTYAKDLKRRLDIATEKMVFIDARSTGEVALLRRLASELERVKPDHELVFREAQQKLIGDKMTQQLAQKGYRYDPATAVMSKIEE
jgi:chromosome segregation ATPase